MTSSSEDDFVPVAQLKKRKAVSSSSAKYIDDSTDEDDVPLSSIPQPKKLKVDKKKSKAKETKPKAKKSDAKKKSSTKVKKETKTKKVTKKPPVVRKLKVHGKAERLDMAIKAYRWWHAEELPEGIAWRKLEHNGVLFPPEYKPHGIKLKYDGHPITLSPAEEELASFYAAMPLDGPQLGNAKTAKIFNKNFFNDFKKLLGPGHTIKEFELCDFSDIRAHLDEVREARKARTKEEKQPEKDKKTEEQFRHGFALLDGHLEKVGNFRIEPPGLFRGRGEHPKTGTFKKAVQSEEVTINVGMGDAVPKCPLPGHAWKEVIHRDSVTWLAYWNENVMGGTKYVWLAASSSFKGKSDLEKYEKARRLKKYISKIRKDYKAGLSSNESFIRQRSTAMWVIDVLALRVGNEKGEDEADTVGCCSLRVEHMDFDDDNTAVTLSFLGKDSMPYNNTIELAKYGDVGLRIYKNLQSFCKKKSKNEDVFSELTPTELNKHLGSLMPGLSAKVFRTYNASITLEQELPCVRKDTITATEEAASKVVKYNDANRKVAILCNHQRTVPKGHESTVEKITTQLAQLEEQLKELGEMKKRVRKGKAVKKFKTPKTDDPVVKKAEMHLFAKTPTEDQVDKKIASWEKKVKQLSFRLQDKEDNKEVALGTSKINYMDPRITVAWCKRNEVPIASVFAKTLREKFVWAMDVDPEWGF